MEVPQELYIMRRSGIIYFFYMDNIIFTFWKKDTWYINGAMSEMRNHFKLNKIG